MDPPGYIFEVNALPALLYDGKCSFPVSSDASLASQLLVSMVSGIKSLDIATRITEDNAALTLSNCVCFSPYRTNTTVIGCSGFHGDCLTLTKIIDARLKVS